MHALDTCIARNSTLLLVIGYAPLFAALCRVSDLAPDFEGPDCGTLRTRIRTSSLSALSFSIAVKFERSRVKAVMSTTQLLYLTHLVVEKLDGEICLRNMVGHIGLGKRVQQLLQTESDLERLTQNENESETFSEDWDAETTEAIETSDHNTAICCICEIFAAQTLNDPKDG
jgi:hypothetical protein